MLRFPFILGLATHRFLEEFGPATTGPLPADDGVNVFGGSECVVCRPACNERAYTGIPAESSRCRVHAAVLDATGAYAALGGDVVSRHLA